MLEDSKVISLDIKSNGGSNRKRFLFKASILSVSLLIAVIALYFYDRFVGSFDGNSFVQDIVLVLLFAVSTAAIGMFFSNIGRFRLSEYVKYAIASGVIIHFLTVLAILFSRSDFSKLTFVDCYFLFRDGAIYYIPNSVIGLLLAIVPVTVVLMVKKTKVH